MRLSLQINLLSIISAILSAFLWGAFPIFVKGSFEYLDISTFMALRFLIATIVTSYFLPAVIKKIRSISLFHLFIFILTVVLLVYIQTYVISKVPVTWYIMIFSLSPIIFIFIKQYRLSFLSWVSVCAAFAGLIMFFLFNDDISALSLWKFFLLFAGMLMWIIYSLQIKNIQRILSSFEIVALTNIIGLVFFGLFWFHHPSIPQSLQQWQYIFLTGLTMPLALGLFIYAMRHKPVFAMFSQYIEPIFGVLLSALLLNNYISLLQGCTIVLVIMGTIAIGYTENRIS